MAARCAGCRLAIVDGEPFLIADTEVFHRACVGLISQSLTTRLKLEVIELKRRLATALSDAADAARLRTAIDDANRDARNVRAERDTFERNLQRAQRRATEYRELAESLTTRTDTVIAASDRVARENDQLRAERDRLIAESVGRDVATAQGRKQKDPDQVDDAAERFRLLELDLDE